MSGYEFKVVKIDPDSLEQDLNALGRKGFRVVLVLEPDGDFLVFLMERHLPVVF